MESTTWDEITGIRKELDATQTGTPKELLLLRLVKVSEEVGEVAEAVHGMLGANPRKGHSHTEDDLQNELCDVALTALVALSTVAPDTGGQLFEDHVRRIRERMQQSAAE